MQALQLRKEFEELISSYQPSSSAVELLKKTPLVLMAGLTASGRNTVIEYLVRTGKYRFVRSDTTRQPRVIHGRLEENGGPYWFKTEEEFVAGLKQHDYLEAAIIHNQQVSGLNVSEIRAANVDGHIAVTEVTPAGIEFYKRLKSDTICLFFLPPSYEIWLDRLKQRGSMGQDEIERRKRSAHDEIEHVLAHSDYKIIVNEELEATVQKVREVIESGTYSPHDQELGESVARQIKSCLLN